MSLLAVRELGIAYGGNAVVDGLSFDMAPGEALGLVGESGSGKSQTALALLGLLPPQARVTGSIRLAGQEVVGASERELDSLRATRIAMVFQDPREALNPYLRIGRQLGLLLQRHGIASGRRAAERIEAMLKAVGLPDPVRQARAWPHQLSGGMRQRVMIAAALITEPDLLVADEPTTALDVTVQAQILELLDTLRRDTSLLLITHDLGVIAGHCDRVLVLERGRPVETGATRTVLAAPEAPATRRLLDAVPRLDGPVPAALADAEPLLEVAGLSAVYRDRGEKALHAVKGVDLRLSRGETLAIVGESGSGKSTLVRSVLGLVPAESGTVVFAGRALPPALRERAAALRRDLQLVFQDPVGSLDPRMRVVEILAEPLRVAGVGPVDREQRIGGMLRRVGLDVTLAGRRTHELSGGQAQRVAIARALMVEPQVLVCDEAVAALDGGTRARILALLFELQRDTGLALLFIAHDLAVVRQLSHRVAVMYLGRIVEVADTAALFRQPGHPYSRALLDAIPTLDGRHPPVLAGETPAPDERLPGCDFAPRCRFAEAACSRTAPLLSPLGSASQVVACHRAPDLDLSHPSVAARAPASAPR